MKYICCECGKLVDEPFAFDGQNYFCSLDCYHEQWSEDEVDVVREPVTLTGAIDNKRHWWNKEG